MERLGPQDASFIYLETPAVQLRYHDLLDVIASRIHLAPRFRQKVVLPPFAVARPVWVDDPNFDLTFHVRRAALPTPRGRRELIDYVQRVFSRPLDRTKPPWEAYIIEEMEDDLSAVITKVHHAMVDGLAAIDIASTMFDFTPEVQILTPPPWEPEPEPSRAELLVEAVREQVTNPVKSLVDLGQ